MKYNLVSSKYIISKVYRDLDIDKQRDISSNIIEWIAEAMQLIGHHNIYEEKEVELPIIDYKAEIPCDFLELRDISMYGISLASSDDRNRSDLYYYIKYPNIIFNVRNDKCKLSYYAIPTDEEGLPMVIDNMNVINAIFEYIVTKLLRIEYMKDIRRFNEFMQQEQRSNFLLDKARAAIAIPHPMEFIDIARKWTRLTNNYISYKNRF